MKKRNVITSTIVIAVTAIILALALTACAPKQNEPEETEVPTETVEVTEATEVITEPTEVVPEPTATEVTEPEEVKPVATQPVTTSKPNNSVNNNNGTNSNGTATVTPATTEPPVATPVQPTPTEPVPEVTEAPAEPKTTEHVHNWQEVYHEEVSHDVYYAMCKCGAKFTTAEEWIAHSESFPMIDAFTYHGSYGSYCETVVDTPAYSTWVCSCGATSDTQP